jgi:putative Mn2+ efflux pump MntP
MLWQLGVLGAALGLNNALASVALGTVQMPRVRQLLIACVFGVFEASMPILGIWLGSRLSQMVGGKAKFIGIVILAVVGLYSLFKASGEDVANLSKLGMRTVVLAVALSLDNLTVGFALGMLSVPLAVAAMTFGLISLTMTLIGLEIGRFLGSRINLSADKLSGAVLLFTAVIMLVH